MIEDIKKACQVMSEGGVILYPTDTVWGIGCDATNEDAVRRVYEIKRRADSKAMLVLVDSPVKVEFYVQDVPSVAWDLIEVADKPLTIRCPQPGFKSACRGWKRRHPGDKRGVFPSFVPAVSQSDCLDIC